MKNSMVFFILLAVLCIGLIAAGCTSSRTTTRATPAQSVATTIAASAPSALVAASTTAAPAPATLVCPEVNGVGILQASWDTRSTGISNSIDSFVKDGGWNGVNPAPKLVLTQKCWDVTGTYTDNTGTGPVSAVMKKDPLTGEFVATGTWANNADPKDPACGSGKLTLTMAADNQLFKGYLLTIPPDAESTSGYPENWAGKKL